jgi:hypothetical protein
MALVIKQLKDVGMDAKLDLKEHGAYQTSCRIDKFDSLGIAGAAYLLGLSALSLDRESRHNDTVRDEAIPRIRTGSRTSIDTVTSEPGHWE